MIEQDNVDLVRSHQCGNLLELALTDKGFGRRLLTTASNQLDVDDVGRANQLNEFSQIVLIWLMREVDVNQERTFAPARSFKLEQRDLRGSLCSAVALAVIRVRMLDMNISGRDDGRNCVFVYHLAYIIFKQYDKLIEGFDLPLEFNSIDQKNRNRNMLSSKCIEIGFL